MTAEILGSINAEAKLLAAVAYGEASIDDNPDEVLGIAFAAANRVRAWDGRTISSTLKADPNYTYAADGADVRCNNRN